MVELRPKPQVEAASTPAGLTVTAGTLAWLGVTLLFLLLRAGPVWQAPVAGAELIHLAGAWQAREGVADDRFIPTLFQAATAGLLHASISEAPARALAFLATASVPLALYLLRPRLGDGGALLALLFLAFDGPAIALGTSASAMGFDVAVTAWLLVALARPGMSPPGWGVLGFSIATAGPLPLALALAALARLALQEQSFRASGTTIAGVAGAVLGVVATSLGFGFGDTSLRIAPVELFADGFDESWSTASAPGLAAIYALPVLLAGAAAAAVAASRLAARPDRDAFTVLLVAWAVTGALWLAVSAREGNPVPVVAATMPLAILLGPATAWALGAMARADWRLARFLLPAAGLLALIAFASMFEWGRTLRVANTQQALLVAGIWLVVAAAAGYLLFDPRTAPTLVAAALVAAAVPLVAATLTVSLSARQAPLLSPREAPQVRQLRASLREQAARGPIVIHPSLAAEATWPLRDLSLVESAVVPAEAAAAILAASQPPEGMTPLDGTWALAQSTRSPTSGFLRYLRWFTNRNTLTVTPEPVGVFVRAQQ
jgi:hypothetical protein